MVHITLDALISQEIKRHPCTVYTRLRKQEEPVRFIDRDGTTARLITSYDDATTLLTDSRLENHRQKEPALSDPALLQKKTSRPVFDDPPNFTRLRPLVAKAFTPRTIEQLRPCIQQITDGLLDTVERQGIMDIITDFAYPLPIRVITEVLGIPITDHLSFRAWSQAIVNTPDNAQEQAIQDRACQELLHYLKTLLPQKREYPGDDLISHLLQIEEGKRLHEQEIIFIVFVLLIAGHETTVNLIGNALLALLTSPEQLHLLQDTPSLIASAVEELLRYTAPVSLSFPRMAREDIPLRGEPISRGERVYISFSAANFDPQQFHEPERLNITRQQNQHLSFGKGPHYCLGAPLARLEGQIALATLLRRMPHLRLVGTPEQLRWNHDLFLRGIISMPVTFATQR